MFPFTCMHLADAFIQSDLQCIQAIYFCQYVCSLGIEPTTFALLRQCSTTEPQEHLKVKNFFLIHDIEICLDATVYVARQLKSDLDMFLWNWLFNIYQQITNMLVSKYSINPHRIALRDFQITCEPFFLFSIGCSSVALHWFLTHSSIYKNISIFIQLTSFFRNQWKPSQHVAIYGEGS